MNFIDTISMLIGENGHIIIGVNGQIGSINKRDERIFFVQTGDGIFQYNVEEMQEIYGIAPIDTDTIGMLSDH